MVLKVITWESVDWMHLARERDQWNTVMSLPGCIKGEDFLAS